MEGYPHFGYSDAEQEVKIAPLFYNIPLLQLLKIENKDHGKSIIIGAKGMGKTALRRSIEERFSTENNVLVLKSSDNGVPVSQTAVTSTESKMVFLHHLLLSIANSIYTNKQNFSNQAIKSVQTLLQDGVGKKLKKVISQATLEAGVPGVKLVLPFEKANIHTLQSIGINDYKSALNECLLQSRAYILIDDPDDVFPGLTQTPSLVEGLVNAVVELNREFRSSIHVILFMPANLYAQYRKDAPSADKTIDQVEFLRWNDEQLINMLASRIQYIRNIPGSKSNIYLWMEEFSGSKPDVLSLQQNLVSKCVNGPRDLIRLANLAYEISTPEKITSNHLAEVERKFSEEKLAQLNQIWGRAFDNINDYISIAFHGVGQYVFSSAEFSNYWDSQAIPKLEKERIPQYFNTSTRRIIQLLYKINFLGFASSIQQKKPTYITSDPDPGVRLDQATSYVIHPAYHQALH